MFIVLLKFSSHKHRASEFMEAHNAWVDQGFNDGVFLMTGSLQPKLGGVVIAHDITLPELQKILKEDPFVAENIVKPEILEVSPSEAEKRLKFLVKE